VEAHHYTPYVLGDLTGVYYLALYVFIIGIIGWTIIWGFRILLLVFLPRILIPWIKWYMYYLINIWKKS
jgi:hypothetical protein